MHRVTIRNKTEILEKNLTLVNRRLKKLEKEKGKIELQLDNFRLFCKHKSDTKPVKSHGIWYDVCSDCGQKLREAF